MANRHKLLEAVHGPIPTDATKQPISAQDENRDYNSKIDGGRTNEK